MNAQELIDLAKPHYNNQQIDVLIRAIEFANQKHAGQIRQSGDPFITHPLSVAGILIEWRLDNDSIVAAVLHDILEDTDGKLGEIEAEFGKPVAFLVDGVSKIGQARSGMGDITTYLPQTRDNLSKLLIAISQDIRVLIIKLADRLHNLRTLEFLDSDRQIKIAKESIEVFAPLADRLGMGRVKIEIEEIALSYLDPKKYHYLKQLIKKRLGKSVKKLEKVKRDISAELNTNSVEFKIDGRIKSTYSLYKKLEKVKGDVDEIYDLMALRIIVNNKDDCYRTLGIIHSLYQPMLTKIKDYISVPKPNGYQSLHTTVLTPGEQIVEFQIRSQQMHDYAERGLAASFHYNEQKLTKNYLKDQVTKVPRNLQWIIEIQELTKQLQDGNIPEAGLPIDLFSDRIFVYSPVGDIYDLPEGATALDFAFAVHSDVGNKAQGVRINSKIGRLSSQLHNGDIVEIITRKNVSPKSDWLNHVKTTKARHKIRAYLNRNEP